MDGHEEIRLWGWARLAQHMVFAFHARTRVYTFDHYYSSAYSRTLQSDSIPIRAPSAPITSIHRPHRLYSRPRAPNSMCSSSRPGHFPSLSRHMRTSPTDGTTYTLRKTENRQTSLLLAACAPRRPRARRIFTP